MQQYAIHVCLISGQAAPNLLPILDTQFKPQKAIFIVSSAMKKKAEYLQSAFEKKGVKVIQSLDLEDEFDFDKMENQLIDLFTQYENENIALNVTGGTKLMAIAAQQVFSMLKNPKPIFYLNTDKNSILFISKDESNQPIPVQQLNAKNDLETYLSSYGFKVISKQTEVNKDLDYIGEGFIKFYNDSKNDIPLLNKYASMSERSGFKVEIEKSDMKSRSFIDLLSDLANAGVIKYESNRIDFKNRENKEYLNGIWLEHYTYQAIKDIDKIDDIALSVDVGNPKYQLAKSEYSNENKGNKNEFDITFIANNKLHIIECKTSTLNRDDGVKAEDILYKLETLKDYGGLLTKKCLVSYFEVPEAVHNRARELKIEIIQGKDLQRLRAKIQEWIARK